MKQEQFICDICKAVKKEVNHWWTISRAIGEAGPQITIAPWGQRQIENEFHLCGRECALRKVEEFMQTSGLADPEPAKGDAGGERGKFPFVMRDANRGDGQEWWGIWYGPGPARCSFPSRDQALAFLEKHPAWGNGYTFCEFVDGPNPAFCRICGEHIAHPSHSVWKARLNRPREMEGAAKCWTP